MRTCGLLRRLGWGWHSSRALSPSGLASRWRWSRCSSGSSGVTSSGSIPRPGSISLPPSALDFSPFLSERRSTLLMSTGLTFGSISALYGLTTGIIDQTQYTVLVTVVVGSAVVPTFIAQTWFQPKRVPTAAPVLHKTADTGTPDRERLAGAPTREPV